MAEQHEVAWTPTAKPALQRLPEKVATAAIEHIHGPPASNPQDVGKAVRFDLEGLNSARRGDYRVIYRIDERMMSA